MSSPTPGPVGSRHHDLQAMSTASSNEAADMTTVDYSKLFGSPAEQKETLKELDHGLQTRFFALDLPTKNLIAHPPSNAVKDHRGYCEDGIGHVNQLVFDRKEADNLRAAKTECKETIEMGNPRDPADSGPNRWPPESVLPGFRQCYEAWWDACAQVEKNLQRALCQILKIDVDTLCRAQERNICHASWIHYPPMPLTSLCNENTRRLNAHTDYGSLTLLLQDTVGGLEVHDGQAFRPVIPKPGTIVVNVGDILERQSNGRWKSALHQVVSPRKETVAANTHVDGVVMDRYVIGYFGLPDPEILVETLPGCETPGQWKPNIKDWDGGEALTSRDWMQKRVVAEYSEYSM